MRFDSYAVIKHELLRTSLLALATSTLVLGCGGGGKSDQERAAAISCQAVTGGGTSVSVTNTCTNCSSSAEGAAIDGDSRSAARLAMNTAASGSIAIRVTAQDGVVYPAGTLAGLILQAQTDGNHTSQNFTVSTYLDGAATGDTAQVGPTNGVGGGSATNFGPQKGSTGTLLPFDAIEFAYTQTSGTDSITLSVYEFCTD